MGETTFLPKTKGHMHRLSNAFSVNVQKFCVCCGHRLKSSSRRKDESSGSEVISDRTNEINAVLSYSRHFINGLNIYAREKMQH